MAKLMPHLMGGLQTDQILPQLRETARAEVSARPSLIDDAADGARWQWALVDGPRYLAGMAIVSDGPRRGWFVSYPTDAMDASTLRPMFRLFNALKEVGPFDELRAWVASDDARAKRFAEWFGFAYDCGPAHGLSPTGADMTLYLWRRQWVD